MCLNVCILKCKLLYSHYPDLIASKDILIFLESTFDEYDVFDVPGSEFVQWLINYPRKNILNSEKNVFLYHQRTLNILQTKLLLKLKLKCFLCPVDIIVTHDLLVICMLRLNC